MSREDFAYTQRAEAAERLEGSRFTGTQLCNSAASGSRECPIAVQFYRSVLPRPSQQNCWIKHYAGSFPGAPASHGIETAPYKAAPLQTMGTRRRVVDWEDEAKRLVVPRFIP